MQNISCISCGKDLSSSSIKKKAKTCSHCISKNRIQKEKSQEFLMEMFSKKWSADLFVKYIFYLEEAGMEYQTMCRLTRRARRVFYLMEKEFLVSTPITEEWLVNCLEKTNAKVLRRSLATFLEKERLLKIDNDKLLLDSINRLIKSIPKQFRRLLEVYTNERMQYRKRQNDFNARNPLKVLTIKSNIESFTRCVRFIVEVKPHILSWDMVQQDDIYDFLLTLTPKNREIVRKSLLVLFKLGKRKKLITHVPLMEVKSRELPPTTNPLTIEEQKNVEETIRRNMFKYPQESLIVSLCFYHGLSTSDIKHIKVRDIDVEKKQINFVNRTPVYLLKDDIVMLERYAKERKKIKNINNKPYLFVSRSSSEVYSEIPVSNLFVRKKVRKLTNFTPKILRITCFNMIAANFGPQLLVEGFGLSLTQASRYGKLEEHLIEELIEEQRAFLE
ncbi:MULTISPECIES: site-specific integrase [Bacillus cereus group]|uniref:Integrase n=1 Tax=Bacillus thuringiensis TaxID=1428 RepID=A0A9X7FX47_BACTU|nr:site-specific integrase [Bacillus thuringiensis]MCQ6334972.1 site-specific integrase [Bacillus cereus]PFT49185.1 integrase [Bacillus thuringiensis]